MMLNRNVLFAMVVAISLSSGVAIAGVPDWGWDTFPEDSVLLAQNGGREDALLDKLDLDNTQKQQILSIRGSYRSQMKDKRTSIQAAQEAMENLIQSGNTSRTQLESQHLNISALRQDLVNLHFKQMMDIRDVLTPAQREELARHMGQKKEARPMNQAGQSNIGDRLMPRMDQ